MNYKIYQNGKEIPEKQTIHLLQEEATGVFESMRAYSGIVFRLEDHLRRLLESAKTVGYKPLPNLKKLHKETERALAASGEKSTSIRLTLFEGQAFVMIGAREVPKELYKKGVALKTASFPRGGDHAFPYQAKAAAYQHAILASTEPHADKIYEWVFLDPQNHLTETRVGNFFLVKHVGPKADKNALLLTPPEHLILNGVTRRFVIKCALELGFRVKETFLTRHDFFNADEAFLSNTSWEILPVRELDGRTIGTGVPGPATLKLHRFFQRRVQADVTPTHSPSTYQRFR